jgi:hypothetical protein
MPQDVFISHASEDKAAAAAICSALEEQGVKCWMAPRDVVPGTQYAEAIVNAIGASRLFVLVFSAHAVSSAHVFREVERAGAKGVPIVTFRIDATLLTPSLEYFCSQSHWINAFGDRLEHALAQLSEAIPLLLPSAPAKGRKSQRATEVAPEPARQTENILHAIWDCLDPNLQDAFSLAYNKKRREGSRRISTRDFFQALRRIDDGPLRRLLDSLPRESLPEPVPTGVAVNKQVLEENPLLSDCVADSLGHFQELAPLPRKISPADIFVDVAKHGHGPSVARLREHGVSPSEIDSQVRRLGLSVMGRTTD